DERQGQSACPHPEAVGKRWGDPISEERQAELKVLAEKQRDWAAKSEAERGISQFKGISLAGADVFWLASQVRDHLYPYAVNDLHLEGADLREAHLERAYLGGAHLEGADFGAKPQLILGYTPSVPINFSGAHLEKAYLMKAHLEGANLSTANLQGADLRA